MPSDLTFVTYENRVSDIVGLKLLALSMIRNLPPFRLVFFCPAEYGDFRSWAAQYPHLQVRDSDELTVTGWEVKPTLLLKMLDEGVEQPIWLDSDIVIARPIKADFFAIADDEILTSSDYASTAPVYVDRAKHSGLVTARRLEHGLNSCVLRVSAAHRPLLETWVARMLRDDFQDAQKHREKPRPAHLCSDQDVLWALLCSRDFSHIPVRQLISGINIAQSWNLFEFATHHRIRALFLGLPPVAHGAGSKPWRITGSRIPFTIQQLQPYNLVARQYTKQLPEIKSWVYPTSRLSLLLRIMALGSTVAAVIPLQVVVFCFRFSREGRWWMKDPPSARKLASNRAIPIRP